MKLRLQVYVELIICSLLLFACRSYSEESYDNAKVNASVASNVAVSGNTVSEDKRRPRIWLDSAHFPDEYLREFLKEQADLNKDGELNEDELMELETLQIKKNKSTLDLTGIGYLKNLCSLTIIANKIRNVEEL